MTTTIDRIAPFKNEVIKNFSDPADAAAMQAALAAVRGRFGEHYPLVIDGKKIETDKKIKSLNPSNPDEVVGLTSSASKEQAVQAIEAAARAFESWKRTTPHERASYLFKAAELVRQRRFHYDALLTLEVGKSWPEADGDVAEGIDFLEYYAREMLRYAEPQPVTPYPGERNGVRFEQYAGMDQDERGVWTAPGGAKVAWFKDPDGNTLSLTQAS